MFRLTAVLLAGLYATMVIWGDPVDSEVSVTRAGASPAVPVVASARTIAPDRSAREGGRADVSAEEAVGMALAAGTQTTPKQAQGPERRAEAAPEIERWFVTGSRVNLRSGPSTSSAIVGGVSLGDRAEVLSDPSDSWTRIRTERGTEAWIYSRFLSETPA